MKIYDLDLADHYRVKLTAYIQEPSPELATVTKRPAVLVLPGGGYEFLSDREAEPVALKYSAEGFQTFVLRYSIGEHLAGFAPLADASQAIGLIRKNADDWHVEPEHIAVCGFSAGGHLACAVGLFGEHKPDALILSYPVIDMDISEGFSEWAKRHPDSSLSRMHISKDQLDKLSLHKHVGPGAPPAFIWHTFEDSLVIIDHTVKLVNAYTKHKIPFEYHVFQKGGHGLSLAGPVVANGNRGLVDSRAARWFDLSVEWLRLVFGPVIVHN